MLQSERAGFPFLKDLDLNDSTILAPSYKMVPVFGSDEANFFIEQW